MGAPRIKKAELEQLGKDLVEWFKDPKNFYLKSFAVSKGIPASYLSEYSKQNRSFAKYLEMAKDMQEEKIVKMGFSGKFSAIFAIFTLKNVAGWRDVIEQRNTDEAAKPPTLQDVVGRVFGLAAPVHLSVSARVDIEGDPARNRPEGQTDRMELLDSDEGGNEGDAEGHRPDDRKLIGEAVKGGNGKGSKDSKVPDLREYIRSVSPTHKNRRADKRNGNKIHERRKDSESSSEPGNGEGVHG